MSRSRSFALSARRTTTGPVETHRGGRRLYNRCDGTVTARSVCVLFRSCPQQGPQTNKGATSQSVSQLFHGPAPRSPLYWLAVRLRHSRSNTSTDYMYSLPGATQLSQVRSISPSATNHVHSRAKDPRNALADGERRNNQTKILRSSRRLESQ